MGGRTIDYQSALMQINHLCYMCYLPMPFCWYVANPIRFRESLKVEIENQRWDQGQIPSSDDYTSIAFWYLDRCQPVTLDPYPIRTASSKARSYAK
jgi:hypothetical protein